MKNKLIVLLTVLSLCFTFTGCGEDPELAKFKNEMNAFCAEIADIDAGINSIDAESETAKDELLEYLDKANDSFKKLANMSIPEEFSYLEELADKASEDMTEAVNMYHDAFSNHSYNEYTYDYAGEYYKRAYKRLTYIISLLHGEIPEGDSGVTVYDEDETE